MANPNEERIKEIEEQIKKLQAEKKALSTVSLASRVDRKIIYANYDRLDNMVYVGEHKLSYEPTVWTSILTMVKWLHLPNHRLPLKRKLDLKDLTEEELKIGADMATEMVDVWNKYARKIYGKYIKEKSDDLERTDVG